MTAAMLDTCKCKPPSPPCPHVYVQYCDLKAESFAHSVAKGLFPEEALCDAGRQFKQQLKKAWVPCKIGRVAALEFAEILLHVLH